MYLKYSTNLVKIWKQSFIWIIPRYFSPTNGNFHPLKTSPKTINWNRIIFIVIFSLLYRAIDQDICTSVF